MKKPKNKNQTKRVDGKAHGYWVIYNRNNSIDACGLFINGTKHGYWINADEFGVVLISKYFIVI